MFKKAISLLEILIVLAIMAILSIMAIFSVKSMQIAKRGGGITVIDTILSCSRSIAVANQRYVGIRFQQSSDYQQYAVFIIHDCNMNYPQNSANPDDPLNEAIPFKPYSGIEPVKLNPDCMVLSPSVTDHNSLTAQDITVSVIFSPAGRLVRKWVLVTAESIYGNDIFGDNKDAIFPLDTTPILSVASIILYNRKDLANKKFIKSHPAYFINTYTGTIIRGK